MERTHHCCHSYLFLLSAGVVPAVPMLAVSQCLATKFLHADCFRTVESCIRHARRLGSIKRRLAILSCTAVAITHAKSKKNLRKYHFQQSGIRYAQCGTATYLRWMRAVIFRVLVRGSQKEFWRCLISSARLTSRESPLRPFANHPCGFEWVIGHEAHSSLLEQRQRQCMESSCSPPAGDIRLHSQVL